MIRAMGRRASHEAREVSTADAESMLAANSCALRRREPIPSARFSSPADDGTFDAACEFLLNRRGASLSAGPSLTQFIATVPFPSTKFSMKNSIIRCGLIPLCPASGPTCTSKLFPACCSALMSCIELFGCTLSSAVP